MKVVDVQQQVRRGYGVWLTLTVRDGDTDKTRTESWLVRLGEELAIVDAEVASVHHYVPTES